MKRNMKKVLALLSVMLLAVCAFAQGIQFEEKLNWAQIQEKAKKENKPIFIDFYTTWCVPCKDMDLVYQDAEVGNYFNTQYIAVKIQMDKTTKDTKRTQGWYKDAEKLEKIYRITNYPSFVFLAGDGKLSRKIIGARTAEHLIWEGRKALDASIAFFRPKPVLDYDTLLARYKNNNLDLKLMRELATRTEIDEPKTPENKVLAKQIADRIINSLPEDSLYTRNNLWLLCTFTRKSTDRGFIIFKDHTDKILKAKTDITEKYFSWIVPRILYTEEVEPYIRSLNDKPDWTKIKTNLEKHGSLGKKTLDMYFGTIIIRSAVNPYKKALNGKPDWDLIKKNLSDYGEEGEARYLAEQIFYYYNNKIWDSLYNSGKPFFHKYRKWTDKLIGSSGNSIAWAMFNNCDSPEIIEVALKFAEAAISVDPKQSAYQDTYANVLYKLGQKEKALKHMSWVVTLPTAGPDIKENYRKMKAGEKTWDPKNL